MTITVGIIGPDGQTRQRAAYAIGCLPQLYVVVETSTLTDFRGNHKETRPMVLLLGIEHLDARGDGSSPFWRGIEWCRKHFPEAPIAVWFESADDAAPQDLHSAGVRGIVQSGDSNDELWTKLIFSVYGGTSMWSRPFKIRPDAATSKGVKS